MGNSIRAFAPATVANVACGFDVLGFAVESPGDEVTITLNDSGKVTIKSIEGDGGILPLDIEKNTVSLVIQEYLKHLDSQQGVEIELKKLLPLKSGMGSSAASSVVGVYALNKLLGEPLEQKDLLPFAMQGEFLACGTAHADNVAPALLGGFVLVKSYEPLDVIKLPVPEKLHATVIHPQVEVSTKNAREILPKDITLKQGIEQWGNLAGLVAGLCQSDYDLISRSLKDVIVEPVRSLLIPGFDLAKQEALDNGALGCSISGSGPSIFALSDSLEKAKKIGSAMESVYKKYDIECEVYVSKVSEQGPRIIN